MKRISFVLSVLALCMAGVNTSRAETFSPDGSGATGTIQHYTITHTGEYNVTAAGAQGASPNQQGGLGAILTEQFYFTAGTELQIAVGQMGTSDGSNGGGGGGSFVVSASNSPLLIAGGGGGTRADAGQNGFNANFGLSGLAGTGSNSTGNTYETGNIGLGGGAPQSSWGSGGGGFYSNGTNDTDTFFGGTYGYGGNDWANGLAGGLGGSGGSSQGGFGGGGSGAGSWGGGGGGGYSGGDGGFIAGGGGSYDSLGAGGVYTGFESYNSGDGYVTISSAVPEPSSFALAAIAATTLGFFGYRRRAKQAVNA